MEKHELVLSDVHLSIPYTILPSDCKIYKDVSPNYSDNELPSERHKLAVSRLKVFYKTLGYDYGPRHTSHNLQLTRKKAWNRVNTDTEDKDCVKSVVDRNSGDLYVKTNKSCFAEEKGIHKLKQNQNESLLFKRKESKDKHNHSVLIDNRENSLVNRNQIEDGSAQLLKPDTYKDVNLDLRLDRKLCCGKQGHFQSVSQSAVHVVSNVPVDKDGDYDVKRRKISEVQKEKSLDSPLLREGTTCYEKDTLKPLGRTDSDVSYINIVHHLATQRDDVGQQVWQGALLLCEYIVSHPDEFSGCVIVDLGAGVGLTSVITGLLAKRVFSTDLHASIMYLAKYNIESNLELSGCDTGVVKVKRLDWMTDWREHSSTSTLSLGLSDEFGWTDTDKQELDNLDILIAADVVYDEDLTEGFFRTFHHFMSKPPSKTLYIGLEKRLLFTLIEQEICCPAYSHFRECLEDLSLCTDNGLQYNVEQLCIDFPQCFQYRRIPQLELWKISTTFFSTDQR